MLSLTPALAAIWAVVAPGIRRAVAATLVADVVAGGRVRDGLDAVAVTGGATVTGAAVTAAEVGPVDAAPGVSRGAATGATSGAGAADFRARGRLDSASIVIRNASAGNAETSWATTPPDVASQLVRIDTATPSQNPDTARVRGR